jgi:hypothetical protein
LPWLKIWNVVGMFDGGFPPRELMVKWLSFTKKERAIIINRKELSANKES